MRVREWNRGVLVGVGLVAGAVQATAGLAMYLAGVYFAPWSMGVSVGVFLLCLVVGTRWYTTRFLSNEITYPQAVLVGTVISVCTGVIYACYNLITISYLYPHFLDEVVRARISSARADQQGLDSLAAMRAQVSVTSLFLKRKM